ncbi:AraC family transcriptional regulator [Maribacter sp. 2307ULW6-5]|uniref:AraC family transcriptional regulator n=1 Tax=Maribacter sp. 2307ULW6-5 TaxID=3386275 RepID=UPI0039BC97DE
MNENLVVTQDLEGSFYNKLHVHKEIQITYIVKGNGSLVVWDSVHSYVSGDLFVIGSDIPHVFKCFDGCKNSHRISIFFTAQTFGADFFEIEQLESIKAFFSLTQNGFRLTNYKADVGQIMRSIPVADKFKKFLMFLELIEKLCRYDKERLTNFISTQGISSSEGNRMRVVLDYVMENFRNIITLEEIAEVACMTPNAFCRFFKERTNKTFFSFLIEMRIEHACHLLKENRDLSVAGVSIESGFKSITNFNRKFKKCKGMTPSEYVQNTSISLQFAS